MPTNKEKKELALGIVAIVLIILTMIFLMIITQSCTYNISMVHTEGQATDIIDATQEADPNISPNFDITPIMRKDGNYMYI